MTGLLALVAALGVSAMGVMVIRARNGRFAAARGAVDGNQTVLTADVIGAPLGRDATLVQFSSSFCSPCRATRVLLNDIAARTEGVETVEIDAEAHLELVRELNILRTPTVLVLDRQGAVRTRASGLPHREQVMAAIAAATA